MLYLFWPAVFAPNAPVKFLQCPHIVSDLQNGYIGRFQSRPERDRNWILKQLHSIDATSDNWVDRASKLQCSAFTCRKVHFSLSDIWVKEMLANTSCCVWHFVTNRKMLPRLCITINTAFRQDILLSEGLGRVWVLYLCDKREGSDYWFSHRSTADRLTLETWGSGWVLWILIVEVLFFKNVCYLSWLLAPWCTDCNLLSWIYRVNGFLLEKCNLIYWYIVI